MNKDNIIKRNLQRKNGRGLVMTGTHVYNLVAFLSLLMLIYELVVWWRKGIKPDLPILLCLFPAVIGGAVNAIKWLARKRG